MPDESIPQQAAASSTGGWPRVLVAAALAVVSGSAEAVWWLVAHGEAGLTTVRLLEASRVLAVGSLVWLVLGIPAVYLAGAHGSGGRRRS